MSSCPSGAVGVARPQFAIAAPLAVAVPHPDAVHQAGMSVSPRTSTHSTPCLPTSPAEFPAVVLSCPRPSRALQVDIAAARDVDIAAARDLVQRLRAHIDTVAGTQWRGPVLDLVDAHGRVVERLAEIEGG
jgi:hypothetical protein